MILEVTCNILQAFLQKSCRESIFYQLYALLLNFSKSTIFGTVNAFPHNIMIERMIDD